MASTNKTWSSVVACSRKIDTELNRQPGVSIVHVTGLRPCITALEVYKFFSQYGQITEIQFPVDGTDDLPINVSITFLPSERLSNYTTVYFEGRQLSIMPAKLEEAISDNESGFIVPPNSVSEGWDQESSSFSAASCYPASSRSVGSGQSQQDLTGRVKVLEGEFQGLRADFQGMRADFQGMRADFQGMRAAMSSQAQILSGLVEAVANLSFGNLEHVREEDKDSGVGFDEDTAGDNLSSHSS